MAIQRKLQVSPSAYLATEIPHGIGAFQCSPSLAQKNWNELLDSERLSFIFGVIMLKDKHIKIRIEQCLALSKASNCPRRKFGAYLLDPKTKCHFHGWLQWRSQRRW